MNARKVFWLILVLALGAIWFLLRKVPVQTVPEQRPVTNTVAGANPPTSTPTNRPVTLSQPKPAMAASPSSSLNVADTAAKYHQGLISKAEAIQELMKEENEKPLDVYGRVVDQYGKPVAGAKVEGSILLNKDAVNSGGETHFTETDSDGRFSFIGIHGVKLGIRPQKDGYLYDLKAPSQRPDDYQPDTNSPMVFTMWKVRGAEHLVGVSISSTIAYDGTPTTFDIATQRKSPDGDLQVILTRSPLEIRRGRDKFNWNITLGLLHGGLVAENDPYPYWAPDSGYVPSLAFSMSTNKVPWNPTFTQAFYIKSSHGQYGLMQVNIYASLTPVRVKFDFLVNPSGSQNLEPSPSP